MWAHLGCRADVHPVDLGRSMEKVRIIPNDLEAPTSRAKMHTNVRTYVGIFIVALLHKSRKLPVNGVGCELCCCRRLHNGSWCSYCNCFAPFFFVTYR